MNRRGFTLIEAIMVIALIALLSIVLVPNIMVFINKNNKNSCEKLIDNIESAAKMYVNQNKYELGFSCSTPKETKDITLKTLVDNGNLTSPIKNPVTKTEVSLDDKNNKVTVTFYCTTKEFSYKVIGINCK